MAVCGAVVVIPLRTRTPWHSEVQPVIDDHLLLDLASIRVHVSEEIFALLCSEHTGEQN